MAITTDPSDPSPSSDPTETVEVESRPRRTALIVAVAMAAVLALFIGVLATRQPSQDRLTKSPLVGKVAPPIKGTTLSGDHFDLDALRGQWVLVNFFATWCVPCRTEQPQLAAFSRRHAQAGDASIVSVVFDDDPKAVQDFFHKTHSTWPVIEGQGTGVILDYAVAQVPESFLVSPNGVVAAKFTGGVTTEGLESVISQFERVASSSSTSVPGAG